LIIHGGRDYRLTTCESLSTFTALQRQGIPSRLVYFPDENHWVLKPANSLRWHKGKYTATTTAEPINTTQEIVPTLRIQQ
jgi:dipeptidyl aminopeptidase/acylaminoacyl peptidase